ncbi:hypothetical protein FRB91_005753 [Serendipita sp. 411]|nr:hypothetical protein FRB91_005753 [Serendipita sp. 411]
MHRVDDSTRRSLSLQPYSQRVVMKYRSQGAAMPSNPLMHPARKNRKERKPPPVREKRARNSATISSLHDQLPRASLQPNQDGLQKVTFASQATKEKSHWELYNELALVYDREMIKEWDDSLSLMLIFGALFSAVLTAFIIASIPLLTEQMNPDTNIILEIISHQLSNSSTQPYTWRQEPWAPRLWTVKVNSMFFTSLGCTLIVSLVSVLCLQWVRDFDKGLAAITNPADRALKRQFRLEGIKKWHLPTIIGVLPTLLVIALILFMAGMVVWLRGISSTVTIISCMILVLGGGFYAITGLCAAIFPSAPFNSSASRLVELMLLVIVRSFQSLYRRHFVSRASQDEWEFIPSVVADTTAFFAGHRHREDEAITSDSRLTSASLFWLLSHIDITNSTVQRLEDILNALLNVDSPESMLDSYGDYKVPWSRILAFLAGQIDQVELERPSFEPKTLARVEILAQVAGVVGVQLYSEALYDLFSSPPTTSPDFQSSPAGVYCRFVRWKWETPMPGDQSTPLQLLKGLARVSNQSSPAFTLAWLSELQSLLLRQYVNRESALEVLIELCNAQVSDPLPLFTQDVSVVYYPDVLRYVTTTTVAVLIPTISPGNLLRAKGRPLDELLETLTPWYCYSKAKESQQNHHHPKGTDLLMKYLIQGILLESGDSPMDVQVCVMRHLRRPHIRALFQHHPEPLYGIEGRSESTTTDHHYQYVENGLRSLEKGEVRWADEISNLLFGYLRMTRRRGMLYTSRERIFAVEVLFTVAYLTSNEGKNQGGEELTIGRFLNGHDPLIMTLDALSSLSGTMDASSSAFMISSGIGSYILPILGKWLEREHTGELMDRVARVGDKTLGWYAYQLLGWEYEDVLPGLQDDLHWESPAWRQALFNWSILPLRSRSSDNKILVALARRANKNHDLVILNYFGTRLSEQKPEDTEYGRDQVPSCLQLLSAALSVFPLVPHLTVSSLGFMSRILDFQSGMRHFIDYGGLVWLAGLPQDMKSAASKHDHEEGEEDNDEMDSTKAFPTTDPFYILSRWFDKGYLDSLNDQYLSTILRSRLVSTYGDDREPRWFLSFVVRVVNHLARPPNALAYSGLAPVVFPEAADCCTRILSHQMSRFGSSSPIIFPRDSTRSTSLLGNRSWFIPAYGDVFIQTDFQAWHLFVRGLIRTLRGEKGLSYPSTPKE